MAEPIRTHREVMRGMTPDNRQAYATAFSWRRFEDAKYKRVSGRHALLRFEAALDRLTGRTNGGLTERQGAGLLSRGLGQPSAGSIPAPSAVSDEEADCIADELVGPVLSSPTSRAFGGGR